MQGSCQGHELGGCQGASTQELVEGARVEGLVPEAPLIGAIGALTSNGVELGESGRVTQGGGYLRGLGVPLSGCIRVFLESVPVGCRAQSGRGRSQLGGGSWRGGVRNGAQGVAFGVRGGHGTYGGCALSGCTCGCSTPVLNNLQGGQSRVGDAFQNVCFFTSHTIMLSNYIKQYL